MKMTGWIVGALFGMAASWAAHGQGNVAEVVAESSSIWNTGMAEVRAGPDESFPAVGALRNGEFVQVYGCVEDYQWCDISDDNLRGWMSARHLTYRSENQPLVIADHGPSLALPVLTFVLAAYWADYYRDRHWYHKHSNWHNWHNWHYRPRPPHFGRPPPRPPVVRPPAVRPPAVLPPAVRPPAVRPPAVLPPVARPPAVRPPAVRPPAVRPPSPRPPHAGNPPSRPDLRPPQRPQRPGDNHRPAKMPDRERSR